MIRILQKPSLKELKQIMQEVKVDPYGIKIMLPKGISHVARVDSLSPIAANILKQEMLSLGGDVALARHALTGRAGRTDCLIMGTLSQFSRLLKKLDKQPFGLDALAGDLSGVLSNYNRDDLVLELGGYRLRLGGRPKIMGIINVTPDSFSGDGLYGMSKGYIVEYAQKMVEDGADIIDVGGESSRPGAKSVSLDEELRRVIPIVKALAGEIKVPVSIDTSKPRVAQEALDSGAVMVNNVYGLRDARMLGLLSKTRSGVVIMHMKGTPSNMQLDPKYVSLMKEVITFLGDAIERAVACGIAKERIIIDPGIGFGKTCEHNLQLLHRLREFKVLGRPVLVGVSRKNFIGKLLNISEPQERIYGTLSACVVAAHNGADILRVHDVREMAQALKVAGAIFNLNR